MATNAGPRAENDSTTGDDVLGCWKDIAAYLGRDVRTVMRWEHTRGLPVHRLPGGPKAAIHASKREINAWRDSRRAIDADNSVDNESVALSKHVFRPTRFHYAVLALIVVGTGIFVSLFWKSHSASLRIHSIVVLPFENLTKDPAQDYFADGIHDSLITELASASDVRVISRTSATQYRAARIPTRQIAAELNVDALVEGSVLRVGDRVRITAQLIRADNEEHVWAATFDRNVSDVLAVVSEVSQSITSEIRGALSQERPTSPRAYTVKPEALDSYLRAQNSFHLMTRGGYESALALHQQSVQSDPNFALPWKGIAAARVAQVWFGYVPPEVGLPEARESALHALSLDERLGEAHSVLGYIALYWDWKFDKAGESLTRAVELSPNSPMVRHQYADWLLVQGRVNESLEQVRLGHAADPLSWPARGILLYHSLMARKFDDVITEGRKFPLPAPNGAAVHDWVARALWLQGHYEEAIEEWKPAFSRGDEGFAGIEQAYRRGGPSAALRGLAEMSARSRRERPEAVYIASFYAAAGDSDKAFEWLEKSYERREPMLLHTIAEPFFDPIRSDARFDGLMRRIGIFGKTVSAKP